MDFVLKTIQAIFIVIVIGGIIVAIPLLGTVLTVITTIALVYAVITDTDEEED